MTSLIPKELSWLDIRPGDIVAVHSGKSLIAKGIVAHMKAWLRSKGHNPKNFPVIIHHIARAVDVWGVLHIAEAVEEGVVVRPMLKAYSLDDWQRRVIILRRNEGYSDYEIQKLSKEMQRLALDGTPYEFGNFWRHLWLFVSAKWVNNGNSDIAMYCSELGAVGENLMKPGSFPHPERTNPMEVFMADFYHRVINPSLLM